MILKHEVRGNSKTGFSSNCSPSFSAVYPESLGSRVIFGWLTLKYLQAIRAVLGNFKSVVVKATPPMAIPPIARRYVLRMLKDISETRPREVHYCEMNEVSHSIFCENHPPFLSLQLHTNLSRQESNSSQTARRENIRVSIARSSTLNRYEPRQ